MAEDSPQKKEPTASEAMFFFAIVKHTRNKADIDWHAVADEQGFKNAEVAKVRFGQVKRKLGINSDPNAPANSSPKTPSTGGTPSKVVKTPTKRAGTKGKGKGGRGKVKKEDHEKDEDDDDMTAVATPSPVKGEDNDENMKGDMERSD